MNMNGNCQTQRSRRSQSSVRFLISACSVCSALIVVSVIASARLYADGEKIPLELMSTGKERSRLEVGQKLELRADPNDPRTVTMQTTPRSWIASLTVVMLLAPIAVLLAIITLFIRSRVLGVWVHGDPAIGVRRVAHSRVARRRRRTCVSAVQSLPLLRD